MFPNRNIQYKAVMRFKMPLVSEYVVHIKYIFTNPSELRFLDQLPKTSVLL
jgi:hypothetical protein